MHVVDLSHIDKLCEGRRNDTTIRITVGEYKYLTSLIDDLRSQTQRLDEEKRSAIDEKVVALIETTQAHKYFEGLLDKQSKEVNRLRNHVNKLSQERDDILNKMKRQISLAFVAGYYACYDGSDKTVALDEYLKKKDV